MTPENAKPAGASGGDPEMIVSEWKPHQKKTLLGFLSLRLPSGLIIRDVCFHQKNASRWVSMPARPYKREDGTDGWQSFIEFADADSPSRFQAAALSAIDKYLTGGDHDK